IEYIKGDAINAELYTNRKLKSAVVSGSAFLRQSTPEKTTELSAPEMNAAFNESQIMQAANTVGQSTALLVPADSIKYSRVTLNAPNALHLSFKGEGLIERLQTDGRTTIHLDASDAGNNPANKTVTADAVNM